MSIKGYALLVVVSSICLAIFSVTDELWYAVMSVNLLLWGILLNGVKE